MATSIIKLHALSGAGEGGSACFVLQIDDFHCLLDCGWSDGMEGEYIKRLVRWAKHLDAVLLSHQELRHLGMLPYLVGSCGLKCPIYATTPVYKMGQLTLYDFYQSMYFSSEFGAFSLDDVDAAFEMVTQVRYQQTVNLPGRGRGICILPLPSGHTLGGTIWKLIKEDVDIVYAVDFNHKKERHLNGATFDACMRPRLLILDASNTLYSHPRRKDRDETLRQCILRSLRRGGNVLIAVDTSGRCLEVAHFLEQCWLNQDSGMMAYGLAMLSFVAFNVVDFAKSMVEWMSEKVMRTFEDQRSNPFHFRHLQLCHTLEQLDSVPEPKVVLASASDLCCGFTRQLFAEWADNDLNTIILTSRDSCVVTEAKADQPPLIHRLIGLAKGDPSARAGLPTSSTGTLVLPLTISQRVSEAQLEKIQNEIPRIRNAVQDASSTTGVEFTKDLDLCIPMSDVEPSIGASPSERSFASPDTSEQGWRSLSLDTTSKTTEPDSIPAVSGCRVNVISNGLANQNPLSASSTLINSSFKLTTTSVSHAEQEPLQLSVGNTNHSTGSGRSYHLHPNPTRTIDFSQPTTATVAPITIGRHQPGYDIYPGLHNHAGGQFFRMTKRTQLLFPQIEKKVHWDEYGGHLDRDLFVDADTLGPGELSELKQKGHKVNPAIQSDLAPVSLLPPSILECLVSKAYQIDDPSAKTHVITHQLEIPLRCELVFLDYEGRSDGEAMKRIVIGLRPQEMILVGNSHSAIDRLASYCRSMMLLGSDLVHTPNNGDVVNCTKEGDIFQARMKDSLVSSLKFTKIRDYELAWVEATLSLDDDQLAKPLVTSTDNYGQSEDVEISEFVEYDAEVGKVRAPTVTDQLPVLNPPLGPIGSHKTVFVNEPKLSDLKQLLLAQGLVAEFVSGVLVVDNCVAIKRSEAGKLLLEGLLSRTYFDVRQILYQQFAIL